MAPLTPVQEAPFVGRLHHPRYPQPRSPKLTSTTAAVGPRAVYRATDLERGTGQFFWRKQPCCHEAGSRRQSARQSSKAFPSSERNTRRSPCGSPCCRLGCEEPTNRCRNLVGLSLQRKVAGVEETHDRAGSVALERLSAGWQEERIIFAPHRQQARPVRPQ